MAQTSDAKVTRPVAQLANLDLNLLVILRELIRERNVTRAAERVHASVRVESYQAVPFLISGTDRVVLMQARLAEKLASPLDLRIMPCPGASEAIVEALWWCEDHDDDPAHRWLRQNLQMLAAEV